MATSRFLSSPELLSPQVSGTSYILWAAENYQDCCKIADEIAAKEAEEELRNYIKFEIMINYLIHF